MLTDIKSGRIKGLIFSKLARLARNTEELLYYSKYFQKHNADLISLNESIDTSTSSGRLFYTMISAMAQWERENNLERMMASLETRRSMGKFTGGMVSHGFKIVDAKVEINEEEAPVRRLIYDLFIQHQRASTVARILNDKGYQTRKGKSWSDITVKRLLKNTDAKGMRKFNYRGQKTKDNPSGIKPQSEWKYLPCPSIVSKDVWEEANAIILEQEKTNKQYKQPLNKRVHLFTSYLKCKLGHKMTIKSKSDRYTCKECRYGIHKDDLEEVFLSRIKQFLISDEELSEYNKSNIQELNLKSDEIEFANTELNKLEAKLEKLIDLNINGEIPTKGFKKHYDPVFVRKENLVANIKSLELELEQLKQAKSSFQIIANKSIDFYDNWNNLDRGQKRDVVEMITNEIIFDNKTILFKLKQIAPLSFLELSPNGQQRGIIL